MTQGMSTSSETRRLTNSRQQDTDRKLVIHLSPALLSLLRHNNVRGCEGFGTCSREVSPLCKLHLQAPWRN